MGICFDTPPVQSFSRPSGLSGRLNSLWLKVMPSNLEINYSTNLNWFPSAAHRAGGNHINLFPPKLTKIRIKRHRLSPENALCRNKLVYYWFPSIIHYTTFYGWKREKRGGVCSSLEFIFSSLSSLSAKVFQSLGVLAGIVRKTSE